MNYRFEDLTINIPTNVGARDICADFTNCGTPSLCNWRTFEPCKGFSLCGVITEIGCGLRTICAGYSLCEVSFPCRWSFCGGCSMLSPIVLEAGQEVVYPEILSRLKEELSLTLKELEAHERDLAEREPTLDSAAQIDDLTNRLESALEQLRARRQALE